MQEILKEHVEQRQITPDVMKNAIRLYIDQFDPFRLYLLDTEATPFLKLTPLQLHTAVNQYQNNDYTLFTNLDKVFQKAIYRARSLRHLTDKETLLILHEATQALQSDEDEETDREDPLPFAVTPQELTTNWKKRIQDRIEEEMGRYSPQRVQEKARATIEQIETYLRNHENRYLFVNKQGVALPEKEQQSLFTLHLLKALASSLDPHTAFFDDSEAMEMKTHLDKGFEGIGIVFTSSPEGFVINEVIPGSPAAQSKLIEVKDILAAINGTHLEGRSLDEVSALLKSSPNQPITLLLARHPEKGGPAQLIEVKLTPRMITLTNDRVESGYEKFQDGIIGWITLHSFYEGSDGVSSASDVQEAIASLKTHGKLEGLVLDLRENGGGYLTQAVKVAGLFISNGVVVISKYNDGSEHFYRDIHGHSSYTGPLIILTSRLTASAAEIVAQALQDYGVALVVGDEQTYGKGTIQAQTVTDNHSTSYFKVTVGKYYTVSGKTTQINGVKADIIVPGPYNKMHIGEAYLKEPLGTDAIEPAFNDTLSDLDPKVRDWYLRYYLPDLQKPLSQWKDLLPELKRLSADRLKSSTQYQLFIKQLRRHPSLAHSTAGGIKAAPDKASTSDLQLQEALNIIKDMHILIPQPMAHSHDSFQLQ